MTKLHRRLNLFSLTVFGIGIIIGAGVYSVIGVASGYAGPTLWISFLLGALVAFLTALSYCELSAMFPEVGSEYIYLKHAYPKNKWLPILMGCCIALVGASTAATVATAFGGYLHIFLPWSKELVALGLITLVTIINLLGIENSSRANIVLTGLEILGLFAVIFVGLPQIERLPDFEIGSGTFTAAALIFFVYLGFEDMVNLAEEAKEPAKDVSRAILLSLAITTILYVGVAISLLGLDSKQLAKSDFPLAYTMSVYAPSLIKWMGVVALFSTANTALISLLAKSRLIFGIARNGDFPKIFAKQTKKHHIPYVAATALFLISCMLVFVGNLEMLAALTSLISLIAFALVNWSVLVLRYKRPSHKRPFRIALSIGKFCVPPAVGLAASLALISQIVR